MTMDKIFLVRPDTALSVEFILAPNKFVLVPRGQFQGCQDCQVVYSYGLAGNWQFPAPLTPHVYERTNSEG